jgi:hypothetical protein
MQMDVAVCSMFRPPMILDSLLRHANQNAGRKNKRAPTTTWNAAESKGASV